MLSSEIYWTKGPWPGRLAMAARPRGGDWLEDEVAAWRQAGVHTVLSLLTSEEERDLDIGAEEAAVKRRGMKFLRLPIRDRQTPDSIDALSVSLEALDADLRLGRNVLLHCRQGIGRTGLVAACLLTSKGVEPDVAISRLSAARGAPVPETPEQQRWIERFAQAFAALHHE